MSSIQFNKEFSCDYGMAEPVSPMIRRIVARNPGPYTFHGTGTYIIGHGDVAIMDPGPDDPRHTDAIINALTGERVTHILVTHTHRDHSPGCQPLKRLVGAPTYGYGPHGRGQILHDEIVEEGADMEFVPDIRVSHGEIIRGDGWSLECVHTPGHTSNHICYQLREEKALLCGDHVMAWSTSIISPPDGNLCDYLGSLNLLLERDDRTYWPCHGPAIFDPKPFVKSYITHRQNRINQVLDCLEKGIHTITGMVPLMYTGLPDPMYPAAARSVLSTLIYLIDLGAVSAERIGLDSAFELTG